MAESFRERVVQFIDRHPGATAKDVAEGLGAGVVPTAAALRASAQQGALRREGGHRGAKWYPADGSKPKAKPEKTMADVAAKAAKKTAKPKRAARANADTGVEAPKSGGVKTALDMLAEELRRDFEAKMKALEILGR